MKPKFYKVKNVPNDFSRVYVYEKEVYFPIESVGLTKSDAVTLALEFNGNTLVGGEKDGLSGIYVSEKSIRKALVKKLITNPGDYSLEAFDKLIELTKKRIAEADNGSKDSN